MKQKIMIKPNLKQEFKLSASLMQSIELLQLNQIELAHFIEREAEENPVLELEFDDQFKSFETYYDKMKSMDEIENAQSNDNDDFYSPILSSNQSEFSFLDYSYEETMLYDELSDQLYSKILSKTEYHIGEILISSLDQNGYLKEDLNFFANRISCSKDLIQDILKIIQTFEPKGVGARSLEECLLIQIKDEKDKILEVLIKNYLQEIAEKKYLQICQDLKLTQDELIEKIKKIRSLNPKPGASFDTVKTINYIIPDAKIQMTESGASFEIIEDFIPRLFISRDYLTMMKNSRGETEKYLKAKIARAHWLIKAILQRKKTLERILNVVCRSQKAFFEKGREYLVPMTQKEMAGYINVHESTVSRAIDQKYVETPQGIFPIKFFFSKSFQLETGDEVSTLALENELKELIRKEDPAKPLSDEKLRVKLEKLGYILSRRTIAKYREKLGIKNSTLRKNMI